MRKNELNNLLRDYVRNHLSPTSGEQSFVSGLYNALKPVLNNKTLIIGSYARFTAIRPLHDLDVLYIAGEFDPNHLDPQRVLNELKSAVETKFENPTRYQYKISLQTHSVTILFLDSVEEIFSVDIVPAYTSGDKNEHGDDVYWVPEILRYSPRNRRTKYKELNETKSSELEWWLKSDPRGYIKAATDVNRINEDFRKTAKLVKRWKHNCKEKFEEFKLKSFHIEQGIYHIFQQNPDIEITDTVFQFFCDLPDFIAKPQIPDRADPSKFIDEYLTDLTEADRVKIIQARDAFLIKLENISQSTSVDSLLEADARRRRSDTEAYLFDSRIPIYIEPDIPFSIRGRVLPRAGSFREFILNAVGLIPIDRKIEFRISRDETNADLHKWKVKNDDNSEQPRGEITDHRTLRDPEHSKYNGNHYVECYAIKNGVCIARARQNIVLQ